MNTSADAERAFYKSFETLNLNQMMAVWDESNDISCIHPAGPRLIGVSQIKRAWQEIMANSPRVKFMVMAEQFYSNDSIAAHIVNEYISMDGEEGGVMMLATNIYRQTENGWRMVCHHASPSPLQPNSGSDEQAVH